MWQGVQSVSADVGEISFATRASRGSKILARGAELETYARIFASCLRP
jgi:hypothetical protein